MGRRGGPQTAAFGPLAMLLLAALGGCATTPDIVSDNTRDAAQDALRRGAARGLPGAAAHYARRLELAGDDESALDAWLAAPPSRWRVARIAGLVDRLAVDEAQFRRLLNADLSLRRTAASVAVARGDMAGYLEATSTMEREAPSAFEGPPDLGGRVAAVEIALKGGHVRSALHHLEGVGFETALELAAHLQVSEALATRDGSSGEEAELIARVSAGGAARHPPGVQIALARAMVGVGRLEEARDVVDGLLGLPNLGPAARREAQLEALRVADMMDDLGTFNRIAAALSDSLGEGPDAMSCKQRLAILTFLAPDAGRSRGGSLDLNEIKMMAGRSLSGPGPCAELRLKIAESLIRGGDGLGAAPLLDPMIGASGPLADRTLRARAQVLKAQAVLQRGPRDEARRLLESALETIDDGDARHRLEQLYALDHADMGRVSGSVPRLEAAAMAHAAELGIPLADAVTSLRRGLAGRLSDYFEIIHHERVDILAPDGLAISRTHWLMCFHDADATQRYGEVPLEAGEDVVIAKTWKVSGGGARLRLVPVESDEPGPDPEIVTLAALEPGDCAELLTLRPHGTKSSSPFYDGPAFYFDDPRGPTHRADWTVVQLEPSGPIQIEPGPQTPPLEGAPVGTGKRYSFGPLAVFVPEDGDARPDRRRVFGRARWMVDDAQRLTSIHAQIDDGSSPPPAVRELARRAIATLPASQWPMALHRAVSARVLEDTTAPLRADVQQSLNAGQGSRALVLLAAARAIGLPASLWLARPLSDQSDPALDLGPLAFDDYSWPLVAFYPGTETQRVIDPRAPSGLPAALVRGADALAVGGPGDPARTKVPQTPVGSRRIRYELTLRPDTGQYDGKGVETLDGLFAESWREFIQKIPTENRPLLMTHVARASFSDATTEAHVLTGLGMHDATLDWHFQVKGSLVPLSPERAELRLGLASDDPLGATGALGVRAHPLFFNQIANTHLELCVRWPKEFRLTDGPTSGAIVDRGLAWHVTVSADQPECDLTITKTYAVSPQWVKPDDFRYFRRLAATITQRDFVRIELTRIRTPTFGPSPGLGPPAP